MKKALIVILLCLIAQVGWGESRFELKEEDLGEVDMWGVRFPMKVYILIDKKTNAEYLLTDKGIEKLESEEKDEKKICKGHGHYDFGTCSICGEWPRR